MLLSEYDFDVYYKSGKEHYVPDALSRNPGKTLASIRTINKKNNNKKKVINQDYSEIFSDAKVREEQLKEPIWKEILII